MAKELVIRTLLAIYYLPRYSRIGLKFLVHSARVRALAKSIAEQQRRIDKLWEGVHLMPPGQRQEAIRELRDVEHRLKEVASVYKNKAQEFSEIVQEYKELGKKLFSNS